MLTAEKNRILTQVGPGTPMGELLRRYWMPIAAVSQFDDKTIMPIRLLGEDLVLYRDLSGTFGLVDRHCPHRRADMSYGFVEKCGIRCNYHGWLYDQEGHCIEQPFDDVAVPEARFKDKIEIKNYPIEVKAGLVWAYLGPAPAPLVPNWEPFTWQHGFVQVVISHIPCNWFQCQENSIDPVHFEWMHRNWSARLKGGFDYAPRHVKLGFDEFEYGFVYRRVTEDADETDPLWTVGRCCLWPNALFTGDHFEWRVPIDDENTLSITWHFSRVPRDREPYVQQHVPHWHGPIRDPQTGDWIISHVMNQDFVAWLGQGTIADRTKEHLGASDRGITLMRKRMFEELEKIGRGDDPKAVIRDHEENECLRLPVVARDLLVNGMTREDFLVHPFVGPKVGYVFQAGQPEHVRAAWAEAMGVDEVGDVGAVLLASVRGSSLPAGSRT